MAPEESSSGRHLLAVGLVAIIGLAGLVLMFQETGMTAQATKPGIGDVTINGCNEGQLMLDARGVEMLKKAGRAKYGADFSPYAAAHINYNQVGYCSDTAVVKELLG